MNTSVVDLLRELIATPSVNPLLAASGDCEPGETGMTAWLGRHCQRLGWPWHCQQVHDGRSNVLALVAGGTGETILWDVHQDTVSTRGMTVDPFQARLEAGRIYGRGACDVKGAMAAMLCAAESASRTPADQRPNLLLSFTVNEECGFTGAASLAELWRRGAASPQAAPSLAGQFQASQFQAEQSQLDAPQWKQPPDGASSLTLEQVIALRPARAIVAEPTSLNVVIAHRGVVRWRCRTLGRAAHSSQPQLGLNAISAMADVVRVVDRFHDQVLAQRVDPLCGPSTAVVTTIRGGAGANTVPEEAIIDIDRRLTTSETPEDAYAELVDHLGEHSDLRGCQLQHEPAWMQSRGLSAGDNRRWAEVVATTARDAGARNVGVVGVPYGTNAATIATAGIPTVVFGPGSIEQAHTADEWIAVDQLQQAVEVYRRIACGELCDQ